MRRGFQPLERELHGARHPFERVIGAVLLVCGLLSIGTTIGIVGVLLFETAAFFRSVPISSFLGDSQWTPLFEDKHFGIWPLVAGTFLTTVIALAVAVPFGLLAAIYLSEIATMRARRILKPILEVLAGVPTVVYGYFALSFVTPLLQRVVPGLAGFNALSPGIVMGIMILPVIASLSEDAIFAVPASFREGAYALGGGKLPTIFRVVLPSAFSGIAAAVILGISRAVGETMIVAIAAGQQPRLTLDPRVPIETMTAYIVQVSLGDTPTGTIEYQTIFAVGTALFTMTLLLNLASFRLRQRVLKGGTH
ncbi:MAG TPA: phosphate ABC transporter permease subunit PstC [Thermoanaerobaculia bacterium]|nr:phosphate ABC transporter permease subunit PstC [Thermoanaerobaculia bacterium]